MKTKEKLDLLAKYQEEAALTDETKQMRIDETMPPEIKQQLAEIEAEFQAKQDELATKIAEIEAEVKRDVISLGETVKGDCLMAVYNKGRISWDSKGLTGYMVAHPEVEAFRKIGEPSISIRRIKKG